VILSALVNRSNRETQNWGESPDDRYLARKNNEFDCAFLIPLGLAYFLLRNATVFDTNTVSLCTERKFANWDVEFRKIARISIRG